MHQFCGRLDKAATILNSVFRSRPSDDALLAVVSNNLVAINGEKDLFDSRKKMKNTTNPEALGRLSDFQKRAIEMNQCLLLLFLNQNTSCRERCKELAAKYPDRSAV